MFFPRRLHARALTLVALLAVPAAVSATDIDGAGDCARSTMDFGDAPEAILAYPGVPGRFPTCVAAGPVGARDIMCAPISTIPGPTGFVRHVSPAGPSHYWLNCSPGSDFGIDSEPDGKVNDTGAALSACANIPVDCVEPAFGMMFGQDDCIGGSDAGIGPPPYIFPACSTSAITFRAMNCGPNPRTVFLNVLIDMNEDGDWNDNFLCGTDCAYEWVQKNVVLVLMPGCGTYTAGPFLVGPRVGNGWMRISLSDTAVPDDYPWNGSVSLPGQTIQGGESEDHPIRIREQGGDQCAAYDDFGDAPEGVVAYPSGVTGYFPTCLAGTPPSTRTAICPPISSLPATTGYVLHASPLNDPFKFWLGCLPTPPGAVDGEADGKVNATGLGASACDSTVVVDCIQPAFGGALVFGQDECWGDADAGVAGPITFATCELETLGIRAFNCRSTAAQAYLNILIDWNEDGDWNDNMRCDSTCVYEWSIVNRPIVLPPGCTTLNPIVQAGPRRGFGWMRVTITSTLVPVDFPWAGSAGIAGGTFVGGETEDYPIVIEASVVGVSSSAPSGLAFAPLAPNPSATTTLVRFQLPQATHVKIVAYDVTGRVVRTLVDAQMPAGWRQETWDFADDANRPLPAGTYFLKLQAGSESVTQRVVRLK